MSGQYPPPNPSHPFTRPPIHQRASPGLPPWGHPQQNTGMNMSSSMNFYGSPHLELPNRGLQQWPHSKPSPATDPLYGLPRPTSSPAQQEETMDLSNTRLEANGTEMNGEVRGPTSVIATNPLRDAFPAATNPPKNPFPATGLGDSRGPPSFVKSVVTSAPTLCDSSDVNSVSDTSCGPLVFPNNPTLHSSVDTLTTNVRGEDQQNLDSLINKSISELSNQSQSLAHLNVSKSESVLDNSSVSEGTDDSRLVVAESSAEDIFDVGEKHESILQTSDNTDKSSAEGFRTTKSECAPQITQDANKSNVEDIFNISEKHESVFQTTNKSDVLSSLTESLANKCRETTATSGSSDKWLPKSSLFQAPAASLPETHPSVENVETLLESMFNSQEDTSCSSQTSGSSHVPSVIVTNGARLSVPLEVPKPQVDVVSPMKPEELALTLAEDSLPDVKTKQEKKEQSSRDELMDEIEKKLEMLTESSSNDKAESKIQPKIEPSIKMETDYTIENVVSVLMADDVSPAEKTVEDSKSDIMAKDSQIPKLNKDTALAEVKAETSETGPQVSKVESETLPRKTTGDGTPSNPFIEVESELAKMFAGIVEPTDDVDLNSDNASQPSVSESKKLAVSKKPVAKRKKPISRRPSDNSTFGDTTPIKKKGRKRINDSGSERGSKKFKIEGSEPKRGRPSKETNGDTSKVKGPFVHIEGSKLSPASVVVVNSGVRVDDDDAADKGIGRRKASHLQRSEGGSKKTGPVYSSSAMSARYNSDKADLTWVCVFCKLGPHCTAGLGGQPAGDLFGPYRIPLLPPHDDVTSPGQVRDKDLVEEQKRRGLGGKYPKSLRASGGADHFIQKMAKKNKRSGSLDSVEGQAGLLLLDGSYEVWVHEQCAEWAPGLSIIGTQLVGLEEAVWTALRTRCTLCGEMGADVGCVVHNCPTRVHYPCAIKSEWHLDTDTFIARCHNHRTRLRPT